MWSRPTRSKAHSAYAVPYQHTLQPGDGQVAAVEPWEDCRGEYRTGWLCGTASAWGGETLLPQLPWTTPISPQSGAAESRQRCGKDETDVTQPGQILHGRMPAADTI